MQYKPRNPAAVEAITFDELVQFGRDHGANIVNGMPWSFTYMGYPVSHENDARYLIGSSIPSLDFTPNDMLLTMPNGALKVVPLCMLDADYEPA